MFYLWCKNDVDRFENIPPIIIVEASVGSDGGCDIIENAYDGFIGISQDEGGYGHYTRNNLKSLWEIASTAEGERWARLCAKAGINVNWLSEEYLRENIPFLSSTNPRRMSDNFYAKLQSGDIVQFGDRSFGVTNPEYQNRWCIVSNKLNEELKLYAVENDGWVCGTYSTSSLRPFFIRNGIKHLQKSV